MLTRIIASLIISVLNALNALFAAVADCRGRRHSGNCGSPVRDRTSAFPIGSVIMDMQDVSPKPTLGDKVELKVADLLMHLYAIGRTGIGKTSLVTVIFDAFVRLKQTFVVIDARGDLISRLLTRLAAAGGVEAWRERLTIIDLPSEWSCPLNVFAMPGDPYGIASAIFDAIEERVTSGLGVQVSECLRASLLTLALGRGQWTLLHIEPLLTNAAFRAVVIQECTDPLVMGFWARYNALSPDQQASWTGAVLNKVTPLLMAVPQLRRSIGQRGCLPFRELIDKPGHIIFINLGISELHGAGNVFGSMVSTAIIRAAMSRLTDTREGERNPTYMMCDEFENYSNALFHEGLQEGRRAGVGLALLHQNLSQISPETSDLILNNARTMCLFGTGARDAAALSREIGGDEAWDARTVLTRQAVGQAYLLRRGEEPVRVQVDYVPDPTVDTADVEAIRQACLAEFARPAKEVDAEISADLAAIRSMSMSQATTQAVVPGAHLGTQAIGPTIQQTDPKPAVEIRPRQAGGMGRRKENKK